MPARLSGATNGATRLGAGVTHQLTTIGAARSLPPDFPKDGRQVDLEWRNGRVRLPCQVLVDDQGRSVGRRPRLHQAGVQIHDPVGGDAGALVLPPW